MLAVVVTTIVAPSEAAFDEASKGALIPCLDLGEDDAGGEVEVEEDTGIKGEVWGAWKLSGVRVVVVAEPMTDSRGNSLVVATFTVREGGVGEFSSVEGLDAELETVEYRENDPTGRVLIAAKRSSCRDDDL